MTTKTGTALFTSGDIITWSPDQLNDLKHPKTDYGDGPFTVFVVHHAVETASTHPQVLVLLYSSGRIVKNDDDEPVLFNGGWFVQSGMSGIDLFHVGDQVDWVPANDRGHPSEWHPEAGPFTIRSVQPAPLSQARHPQTVTLNNADGDPIIAAARDPQTRHPMPAKFSGMWFAKV